MGVGELEPMNDVQVYCAYDELVDPVSLVPNPRNPNQHPDRQIELLAKMIEHQGWRTLITVSNRSGFVVRGHVRLQAAFKLGVETMPVDRQDYAPRRMSGLTWWLTTA